MSIKNWTIFVIFFEIFFEIFWNFFWIFFLFYRLVASFRIIRAGVGCETGWCAADFFTKNIGLPSRNRSSRVGITSSHWLENPSSGSTDNQPCFHRGNASIRSGCIPSGPEHSVHETASRSGWPGRAYRPCRGRVSDTGSDSTNADGRGIETDFRAGNLVGSTQNRLFDAARGASIGQWEISRCGDGNWTAYGAGDDGLYPIWRGALCGFDERGDFAFASGEDVHSIGVCWTVCIACTIFFPAKNNCFQCWDLLIDWLIFRSFDRLIDRFLASLIDWLIAWLRQSMNTCFEFLSWMDKWTSHVFFVEKEAGSWIIWQWMSMLSRFCSICPKYSVSPIWSSSRTARKSLKLCAVFSLPLF